VRRTGNGWNYLFFISETDNERAERSAGNRFPFTQQFIIISFSVAEPVTVLVEGDAWSYHYVDGHYIYGPVGRFDWLEYSPASGHQVGPLPDREEFQRFVALFTAGQDNDAIISKRLPDKAFVFTSLRNEA